MIIAIYVRVSTLDQALEGYSLDSQQRVLRDWCNTRGHSIYGIYKDAGISGKDIQHRPAVREMLAAVEAGKSIASSYGHFRDLQEAWLIYMPCGKRCAEIIVS